MTNKVSDNGNFELCLSVPQLFQLVIHPILVISLFHKYETQKSQSPLQLYNKLDISSKSLLINVNFFRAVSYMIDSVPEISIALVSIRRISSIMNNQYCRETLTVLGEMMPFNDDVQLDLVTNILCLRGAPSIHLIGVNFHQFINQ
jgi:hypothetical protein